MNWILTIFGAFLFIEGFLNILYWKDKYDNKEITVIRITGWHKYIVFQIGRFIRTIIGYILIMVAY